MQVLRSPAAMGGIKRVAAMLALISVFCLPLHFHPLTAPAHITKECACLNGSRSELGLPPPVLEIAPLLTVRPLLPFAESISGHLSSSISSIRAPPAPSAA